MHSSARAIPIPPSDKSLQASIKPKEARSKINLPCCNSSSRFILGGKPFSIFAISFAYIEHCKCPIVEPITIIS